MATIKSNSHGGARAGSGRKPQSLTTRQVKKMMTAANKRAKENDKTIDDVLLDLIYNDLPTETEIDKDGNEVEKKPRVPPSVRVTAIKLFKDFTMAKIEEGGETDKAIGPAVYLPEERPDPAKVVPITKEG